MKRILFVLLSCAAYGCSSTSSPAPAPTAVALPVIIIANSAVTTWQEYPASIEGIDNLEIRPQISGILQEILVDEGAFVQAGQPLFRIDEQPYQATLANATASLQAANGALQNANLEVEKLTPLVQNKVLSDFQLRTAVTAAGIAQANIEQAKAIISTAKINLGYTLIRAPVSGYISRLPKKKGSLVGPGDADALTQLSDVRNVRVYFSLAESDFVNFKEQYNGESLNDKLKQLPPVSLLLSNDSPYTATGKVDMIDGQFDKNTGAITFRANFPNPKGLLRSGNTGKIRMALLHPDAVVIPQIATIEMQDKVFVFALDEKNKVRKQPIAIAGRNGQDFIIKEGLRAGDRIVLEGLGSLQEGSIVDPQQPTKPVVQAN